MSKKSVNIVKNSFTSHNRIEIAAKCINKHLSAFSNLPDTSSSCFICTAWKKCPLQRKCIPLPMKIVTQREKEKSNLDVTGAKTYALNSEKKSTNFEKGQWFFYCCIYSVKSDFQRDCLCLFQNINFANGAFFH